MKITPTRIAAHRSLISALALGLLASMGIAGIPPDVAADQAQRDACHARAEAIHEQSKTSAERARDARHAATAADHDARAAERAAADAALDADLAREAWEQSGDRDDLIAYKQALQTAKVAAKAAAKARAHAARLDYVATRYEHRADLYKDLAKAARHRCAPGQMR